MSVHCLDETDQRLLLCIQYVCHEKGIKLPWDSIGRQLDPLTTESAITQHLAKLRGRLIAQGLSVPPVLRRTGASTNTRENEMGSMISLPVPDAENLEDANVEDANVEDTNVEDTNVEDTNVEDANREDSDAGTPAEPSRVKKAINPEDEDGDWAPRHSRARRRGIAPNVTGDNSVATADSHIVSQSGRQLLASKPHAASYSQTHRKLPASSADSMSATRRSAAGKSGTPSRGRRPVNSRASSTRRSHKDRTSPNSRDAYRPGRGRKKAPALVASAPDLNPEMDKSDNAVEGGANITESNVGMGIGHAAIHGAGETRYLSNLLGHKVNQTSPEHHITNEPTLWGHSVTQYYPGFYEGKTRTGINLGSAREPNLPGQNIIQRDYAGNERIIQKGYDIGSTNLGENSNNLGEGFVGRNNHLMDIESWNGAQVQNDSHRKKIVALRIDPKYTSAAYPRGLAGITAKRSKLSDPPGWEPANPDLAVANNPSNWDPFYLQLNGMPPMMGSIDATNTSPTALLSRGPDGYNYMPSSNGFYRNDAEVCAFGPGGNAFPADPTSNLMLTPRRTSRRTGETAFESEPITMTEPPTAEEVELMMGDIDWTNIDFDGGMIGTANGVPEGAAESGASGGAR